ncbi:MAG: pyruvate carboxylase subunit B, partial [Candidatus Methanofastidiosia archaeon]
MIKITDTTFRDAHQSHLATRLKTKDLLKIAEKMDEVGFFSCEMWGGATFDSCLRFLKENPWDRIKLLKQKMRKTPFQMLLRGQNIVGYKHYPDDVLESFIKQA